jgi:signal transduction histidine kinase
MAASRTVTPAAARRDAWEGSKWQWDGYFAAILAITLILVLSGAGGPLRSRLVISAVFVAMAGWYVLAGRPVLFGDVEGPWRGEVYLAGLVPLFAITAGLSVTNTFILLALCPQCFMAVSFRRAVAAVVVLNATPLLAALVVGHRSAGGLANIAGAAVLVTVFSIVFGSWVLRIIEQNVERRQLIEQLEATRADLARAEREAGALAERGRLASEIHDTIAQGLTSVVMLVQAADGAVDAAPSQAKRHLALAADAARESLAEARTLVAGLAPAQLAAGTIDDALRRLAGRASAELPGGAGFEARGAPRPLATATEVVLLRVCQEALANVRRHAGARRAWVCLDYRDGEVRLEIGDDGTGFDPAGDRGGYGLRGMRSRAAQAGGILAVLSSPGAGTTVSVAVPG